MNLQEFYNTIEQKSTAEFKDRGSRFISFAFAIKTSDDFKQELVSIKKDHPKAVHHCFAYRIGIDGNTFRCSDDGEPSGSAGKPILGQIDSKSLTNIAVVVVRYWGGSLLGVPGLINAYKSATALSLQLIPIVKKQIEIIYSLEFDYTKMNVVMTVLKQNNCTIYKKEMQLFCIIEVGIAKNKMNEVLYKLNDLQNIIVKIKP